uniref:Predicted protein n=1 Tax=Hordeum vulgare subsp. vulgare TaxID=112509 RepID=F2DZS4_HORVV|nr:predicted protein [Hordeum vulgare subsp. vulgare]
MHAALRCTRGAAVRLRAGTTRLPLGGVHRTVLLQAQRASVARHYATLEPAAASSAATASSTTVASPASAEAAGENKAPATQSANGPKRDALAAILARLLRFQAQLPAHLVARLATDSASGYDGPLRILVVADRHVGRGALINALLGYPGGQQIVNEEWGTEVDTVIHVQRGDTLRDETVDDAGYKVRHIEVPACDAVQAAEWTVVPPLSTNWPHLSAQLAAHDLVLLVTDTPRHLTTPLETAVASRLAQSGQPATVAINGLEYLTRPETELPRILAAMQAKVGQGVPLFPVSSRRAGVAMYLSTPNASAAVPESAGAESGIPALAVHLASLRSSPTKRHTAHARATLAAARAALDHVRAQHARAVSRLAAADAAFDARVAKRAANEQARLLAEFHDRDAAAVDAGVRRVASRAREWFAGTPFWVLPFRADGIAAEMRSARGGAHVMSEAETRMGVAAGRLGEGARYAFLEVANEVRRIVEDVEKAHDDATAASPVTEPLPPVSSDPAIAPLLAALDRIHAMASTHASAQPIVDPFALSNVVWRTRARYEHGSDVEHVRSQAEALVLRAAGIQAGIWILGIASVVYGFVPAGIGAMGGAMASAVGLEIMRRGWAAVEDEYVGMVESVKDGLHKDLLDEYHKLVSDKVTTPLENMIELYEQALTEQATYLESQAVELDALQAEIEVLRKRYEMEA